MKKLWLALWVCAALLPRAAALSAAAAVTMDADTGETLFAENADSRLPMASTTKIMTALVALGEGDLDRVYTVKKQYAAVEGSSMYLEEGERLTLRDTLYGLLLSSGNDAAAAVAGECGGERAFVDKMNAKARELGLTDTRFENPSGLPSDGHYTRACEDHRRRAARPGVPRHRVDEDLHGRRPHARQPQPSAQSVRGRDRRQDRLHARCRALSGVGS